MVRGIKVMLFWAFAVTAFFSLAVGVLPKVRYDWHCVVPDLFIITCICVGLRKGSLNGAIVGLMLGLFQGSLVGAYHGQYGMSRLAAGFSAGWAREYVLHEHWLMPFLCALVGSAVCEVTMLMTAPQLLISFGKLDISAVAVALVETAYAVSIAPLVILTVERLHSKFSVGASQRKQLSQLLV